MKLSYQDKMEIYKLKKSGISFAELSKKYEVRKEILKYLVRLIDLHGFEILRGKQNKSYSKEEKVRIINRVLLKGESANSVSLEEGIVSNGMIFNWISKYRKNGYNVIEKRRGRIYMTQKTKIKPTKQLTREQELEQQIEYLKAENEYLKKLEAVVLQRELKQKKK